MKLKFLAPLFALLALVAIALTPQPAAAVTLWSPLGDLNFPGLTPGPAGGLSTPIVAAPFTLDTGTKTATATGTTTATATLNKYAGRITSASLTTAAGATYVLTLTDSTIAAADHVFANVGTAGTGTPTIGPVVLSAGQAVITVQNIHGTAAFNNVITIDFMVVKN